MTTLVLRGGSILDGTGSPARTADLVIRDGRLAEIRERASAGSMADRVIDVDGLTVAPGFIDAHSHADYSLPSYPDAINSLSQGVTTEVLGNCGYSPAPLAADPGLRSAQVAASAGLGPELTWDWTTFAEFADRLDAARPAVDCALLVGHGQIRIGTVGADQRPAQPAEIDAMRAHVGEALDAGAWGMSTGLVYPPGSFASTDELIAVGEPLRDGAGIYASHIRSEGYGLAEALREAIAIGRGLATAVEVSHLKAAGQPNHGRGKEALAILDEARAQGLTVGTDAYPYLAGSTLLTQLLPPWVQDGGTDALIERLRVDEVRERVRADVATGSPGWMSYSVVAGGWDRILLAAISDPSLRADEGLTVAAAAARAGKDPLTFVFDLLVADQGRPVMIVTLMADADVEAVIAHPSTSIGSDQLGVLARGSRVHPRCYGTFARILGWAVRERGLMTLPEAIRRMTSLPSSVFGFVDRGRIAPGFVADLVAFDPARVIDRATYEAPTLLAEGIETVILGGAVAVDHGEVIDAHLGRVLRRPRR